MRVFLLNGISRSRQHFMFWLAVNRLSDHGWKGPCSAEGLKHTVVAACLSVIDILAKFGKVTKYDAKDGMRKSSF